MKKVPLLIILLIPFCLKAQEDLLGKNRCDINIAFQNAKTLRVANAEFTGAEFSDTFNTGKFEQIICNYDEMEICTEVVKIMKTSSLAATLKNFDNNYMKADGELMLKNTWVDKARTFKVHIENWTGVNRFYLDYVAFDKQFMKK
jgi:hypothetical protein